jgi:alkylation response protein AidB-like acyl-CoA dehydrogenase
LTLQPTTAVRPGSPELAALLQEIGAGAAERERELRPPHDAIDLVRRARLGALRVPLERGGGGASVRELFEVLIALAAADSNVAHILRTHFQFVEERLIAVGDDRWMDDIVGGAIFGNATTELGNQDVGGRTFATMLSGGVLTGTKYYCTGSLYSDFVPVLASTPEGEIVTVVVPADRDGVTLEDDWDGIGQKLTGTGTVRLDAVRVSADEVLGVRAVEGERAVRGPFLQLFLTAVMAGVVRAAAHDAIDRARKRTRVFTHGSADTVAADPLVQQVVGEISSAAFAVEAIVLRAAEAIGAATDSTVDGVPDGELTEAASLHAAQAKVSVEEIAFKATTALFEVGGASATKREHDLDRHWRNARTIASHNPTIYKARAIGDVEINGVALPPSWFF